MNERFRFAWILIGVVIVMLGSHTILGVAQAQSSDQQSHKGTGFELGLRLGYAVGLGNAGGSQKLSEMVAGQLPIWIDLGYRVLPQLFVGVYGQYGVGFLGSVLDQGCSMSNVSCSSSDVRIGLQAHFHPLPQHTVDPWFGLGFGYEWLAVSVESGGDAASLLLRGFEFLHLQGGVNFRVADNFWLGPTLSLSLGEYANGSVECSGPNVTSSACSGSGLGGSISDKSVHEWLMFGLRGAYAP